MTDRTLAEQVAEALRLAQGRLLLLCEYPNAMPESDHPAATHYVVGKVTEALAALTAEAARVSEIDWDDPGVEHGYLPVTAPDASADRHPAASASRREKSNDRSGERPLPVSPAAVALRLPAQAEVEEMARRLHEFGKLADYPSYPSYASDLIWGAEAMLRRLSSLPPAVGEWRPTPSSFYVASRASLPERSAMWRAFRDQGVEITSSWIDEAGDGETADFSDLWDRIQREIAAADRLVLYAEPNDFPLKGALIETGIALGLGKPVTVCLPGVRLAGRTSRPVGSWLAHRLVTRDDDIQAAMSLPPAPPQETKPT